MALLQEWREIAYSQEADRAQLQKFWTNYFLIEKGIYEKLLADPTNIERGTVKELAEKFDVDVMTMVGFLDGINDSLKVQNPIEEMEEDTVVNLGFDTEMLYKNMVDAKADWLYNLPMWDEIFTEEQKKTLYMDQKKSGTVIKGKKIGRNDPCLARKYRSTPTNIEHDIRTMVNVCWEGNKKLLDEIAGYPLEYKPTNSEFIDMLAYYLREMEEEN